MFASWSFGALQGGRNSLDMPVAALAGLAIAFLALAAPADLLANLVVASGLPSLIAAAEPPLGLKARIGLGAGGALIAFATALLVLRWLDRFGARRAEAAEEAAELEAPRLRRRDIHPDAPARPPLLAVHELGEPELVLDQVEPEPVPAWDEAPLLASKPDRQAEPEPAPAASLVSDSPACQPPAPVGRLPASGEADQAGAYALSQRNWAEFEPEPQAEAETDHPRLAETFDAAPIAPSPSSSPQPWPGEETEPVEPEEAGTAPGDWPAESVPVPMPEPQWEPPVSAEPTLEREAEWQAAAPADPWAEPTAAPATMPPVEAEPETASEPEMKIARAATPIGSIAELMERLEKGLARHRPASNGAASPPAAAAAVTPARPIEPDPADDRLQNAIERLQRFASRQD